MSHRRSATFLAAALGVGLAACASSGTKLVSSFREPSAGPLKFSKVLVLVMAPHESQRQFGEAELVRLMKRTKGVAATSVMSQEDLGDQQKLRAFMAREGFDGAVTMRFVGSGQQLSYQSGVSYAGFWDYYTGAWPMVYDPGYIRTDRVIHMDTQVFSMKDGKLVWAGLSESINPDNAQALVDDVARVVGADLRKQGLIE